MKTRTLSRHTRPLLALLLLCMPLRAEDEIEKAFRDALYAEEVKGDTEAALKAYQEVAAKFEQQRDMAATALFRQAECLRKLGRKDEAAALYNKVLTQYGDKERSAKLSRENLAALGRAAGAAPATAAPDSMTEEEAKELTRLKALAANSPDLLDQKAVNGNMPALDTAAMGGQTGVVQWLLKNLPGKLTPARLEGPLKAAAKGGHLKVCELLLEAGADVNEGSPLMAALGNKRLAVVRLLMSRKADPNLTGNAFPPFNPILQADLRQNLNVQYRFSECPPLIQAAADDGVPPELLKELLDAGAVVNASAEVIEETSGGNSSASNSYRYNVTPLGAAASVRNIAKVRLLLSAKADVNQKAGDLDASPLMLALIGTYPKAGYPGESVQFDDEIVTLLAGAGADWKARLSNGITTLHMAARRGLTRWVEEAIKAGVDVNAPDQSGYTPLHFAAESGSLECVQKLLAAGAKVDAATSDDWKFTPLCTACFKLPRAEANLEILKALLDAKSDPNVSGAWGSSIFNLLLPAGNPGARWPEAAVLLSERGARVGKDPSELFSSEAFNLHAGNQNQGPPQAQTKVSPERLLTAFRVLWKATNWRDNPRLAHALWLDDGETQLRAGGKPRFSPQFCDDSALTSPPSLRMFLRRAWWQPGADRNLPRDFSRVTVTRMKDGKEEAITVDLLALATKANAAVPAEQKMETAGASPPSEETDFPLQWGDVVSIPKTENPDPAASQLVQNWCCEATTIKVRLALAGNGIVTNAAAGGEPLWISTVPYPGGYPAITTDALLRDAGIPAQLLRLTIKQERMAETSFMEAVASPGHCFHGDILTVHPPEPQARLSEDAMRAGIWLCHSMEGPFYPVATQQFADGAPAPLGGLLLALMAPHPLPFTNVDWDKAKVIVDHKVVVTKDPSYTAYRRELLEKRLLDAWHELALAPGTVLVIPPAEKPLTPPPAALLEALKTKLSFDWQLAIGQQPEINSRWEPRFFQRTGDDKTTAWQDIDAAAAGRPLLPVAADLMVAHPSAGSYLPVGSPWWPDNLWPLVIKEATALKKLQFGAPDWLPADAKISVTPAPRSTVPPGGSVSGGAAISRPGQTNRRVYPLPGSVPSISPSSGIPGGRGISPTPAAPAVPPSSP